MLSDFEKLAEASDLHTQIFSPKIPLPTQNGSKSKLDFRIFRDVHFAVNSKILLSAVTQFEFAVNRNYQRYEKRWNCIFLNSQPKL